MRNVPRENLNENLVVTLYYVFKLVPTLIAGGTIYLGYNLFILGVTGKASLSLKTAEVSGQLLNAAPGLFFAVGGIAALIIIVWKGVNVSFEDRPPSRLSGNNKNNRNASAGDNGGHSRVYRMMNIKPK